MDVASGNVANAGTAGYARRQVIGQATGAPALPALWSRWEGAGDGVERQLGVDRMVDPLMDARSRAEHSASSFLDTRSTSLVRFETAIAEPGDGGVAAALDNFQAAWHDVANNPGDSAAGTQLLARAETLRATIATQAQAVSNEWSDQRDPARRARQTTSTRPPPSSPTSTRGCARRTSARHRRRHPARPARPAHPQARLPDRRGRDRQPGHHRRRQGRRPGRWSPATRRTPSR